MNATVIRGSNVDIRLWTRPEEVEQQAMRQLHNISALPWAFKHIAVMPDVHYGKGATVGSVIAMRDAVSPAAVGVDIGCGMAAVRTSLTASDLPDDLSRLRSEIEKAVPVGFGMHRSTAFDVRDAADWDAFWKGFDSLAASVQLDRAVHQMGTLGGGNHFIEVCLDTGGQVWVMLHSGSRGVGNILAQHHISVARTLAHNAELPDPDLAVFLAKTPEMAAYRHDLYWAQDYARRNRAVMLRLVCSVIRAQFPQVRYEEPISCHHNYVAEETHFGTDVMVTRKGAIRAGAGDLGIIPGSMAPARTSSAAWETPTHSSRPPTEPAAACPATRPASSSPRQTSPPRPPASNAARTPASSTRSPPPTRTSTRSWPTSQTWWRSSPN